MKTLILYATKHGATRKIAELISQEIPDSIVRNVEDQEVHLDIYDRVILGSSLMAGQIRKPLKKYVLKHKQELLTKQLGLFLSGFDEKQQETYFSHNFPPEIVAAAKAKALLGGIYDPQKCNPLERAAMKAVAKLDSYAANISTDKISEFVKEFCQ